MENHPLAQMASPDAAPDPVEANPPAPVPAPRDALAEAVVENTRTTREMLDRFLSRQAQAPPSAPATLPPDPGPIPNDGDPASLEHWMRSRDARLRAEIRAELNQETAATNESVVLSTMWNEILTDPATAQLARENPDIFRMAFRDEGGRLPQGVNPQDFKQKIVGQVQGIVGRFSQPASATPPATPTVVAPVASAPVATPNRTAGLSGPSAQVARAKAEVQDSNRGLLDDIRDIQDASPYF